MKIGPRNEEDSKLATDAARLKQASRPELKRAEEEKASQQRSIQGDGKVQISNLARELLSLDATTVSDEVRTDRVQRLKKLIESGEYKPDSSEVARKLIEELTSI